MNYIVNNNPKVSRITSMGFLNAHDLTLLLTGTGKNRTYFHHPLRGIYENNNKIYLNCNIN